MAKIDKKFEIPNIFQHENIKGNGKFKFGKGWIIKVVVNPTTQTATFISSKPNTQNNSNSNSQSLLTTNN